MAQPTPYDPLYKHTGTSFTGSRFDQELAAIQSTINKILANLARIQCDDTALANQSVGFDQLKTELRVGINPATVWATATAYVADSDVVVDGTGVYRCIVSHTSGTFSADLAAGKWELLVDLEPSVGALAYSATTGSLVTAVESNGNHVDFSSQYSIPANTLEAGSVVRISALVRVQNASGADTLEVKLHLGSTELLTTTAFDPDAAGDHVVVEFEFVIYGPPSAAAVARGYGQWLTSDGGSVTRGTALLLSGIATNSSLLVKLSAKWSSNTAGTEARLLMLNVLIF